jgi:hypothetical protein
VALGETLLIPTSSEGASKLHFFVTPPKWLQATGVVLSAGQTVSKAHQCVTTKEILEVPLPAV